MLARVTTSAAILLALAPGAFAGPPATPVQPGQAWVAGAASGDRPLSKMTLPLEAKSKKGQPGGPINVVFVAAPGRVEGALEKAGWSRADKVTPKSAVKIAKDVVERKPYPTAPVSAAYLFGRKQDEAWEKEQHDPRVRDHLRLWDSGKIDAKGRHLYAVDASKDVGVGRIPHTAKPTHKIDPDIDKETVTLLHDLKAAGQVANAYPIAGMGPKHKTDVAGNPYFTRGQVEVIVLN